MELTPDRQFTAHKFGSFVHATQAPVSRAAVVGQNLFVYACPIIANSHLQLVLVIVDLRFDPPRLRGPEGKLVQTIAVRAHHTKSRAMATKPTRNQHDLASFGAALTRRLLRRVPSFLWSV